MHKTSKKTETFMVSNIFCIIGACQVRRALLIMHQRDEVEYKRERRVIVRKA